MKKRAMKAFTLVEILIVVVILGILAAIVVPQFTSASEEAQIGNVQTQLQTIRSQIELYRVKNNGEYPDFDANGWDDLVGADYLVSAPVNPRTGTSDITDTAAAAAVSSGDAGWVWDGSTMSINGLFEDDDSTDVSWEPDAFDEDEEG